VSQRKPQFANGTVPASARASPDELAERHLSLVMHIAGDFKQRLPPGVSFDDLVGAGNLGLVEAARRFNPAKGASFSTFARHRIRGAITDSLAASILFPAASGHGRRRRNGQYSNLRHRSSDRRRSARSPAA